MAARSASGGDLPVRRKPYFGDFIVARTESAISVGIATA